jgi:outer membrane protein
LKNSARLSFAALILILMAASVGAETETKIGVISTERVMRDSDPAKKAMKKLEKEFEKRGQEVEKSRQQLQKIQDDLEKGGVTMPDGERKTKEKEFADLNREYQRRQRELNEDINSRRNEELQSVVERTNKAIKAIAEKEGFDLIVQEAVYANPRVDITDRVIKALSDSASSGK